MGAERGRDVGVFSPLVERSQQRAGSCVRCLTAFDRALESWQGRGAKPNPKNVRRGPPS